MTFFHFNYKNKKVNTEGQDSGYIRLQSHKVQPKWSSKFLPRSPIFFKCVHVESHQRCQFFHFINLMYNIHPVLSCRDGIVEPHSSNAFLSSSQKYVVYVFFATFCAKYFSFHGVVFYLFQWKTQTKSILNVNIKLLLLENMLGRVLTTFTRVSNLEISLCFCKHPKKSG